MLELDRYVVCVDGADADNRVVGFVTNIDEQDALWNITSDVRHAAVYATRDQARKMCDFCTDPEVGATYVVRSVSITLGPICG